MYQFFNDYYVANNMVLSLAGNFDTESILPIIKEKFGRIKSGEVPKLANYVEDDFEQRFSFFYDFPAEAQLYDIQNHAHEVIFERITQDIYNATLAKW